MATGLSATNFRDTPLLFAHLAGVIGKRTATRLESEPEAEFDNGHQAE